MTSQNTAGYSGDREWLNAEIEHAYECAKRARVWASYLARDGDTMKAEDLEWSALAYEDAARSLKALRSKLLQTKAVSNAR